MQIPDIMSFHLYLSLHLKQARLFFLHSHDAIITCNKTNNNDIISSTIHSTCKIFPSYLKDAFLWLVCVHEDQSKAHTLHLVILPFKSLTL